MNGYEKLPKCDEKDCKYYVDGHCNDNGEVHCPNKPIKVDPEIKWREDVIGTLKLMSNIIAEQADKISELECRVAKIEDQNVAKIDSKILYTSIGSEEEE